MEIKKKIGVAVTTCSSKESASRIVNDLLMANLIACGQIEGPIESIYQWKGKLEKETEWKISLKFDLGKQAELQEAIKAIHPYDTPQWVAWEAGASDGYYDWVVNPS
jgi:periplasmic divalent cation tolerance protein